MKNLLLVVFAGIVLSSCLDTSRDPNRTNTVEQRSTLIQVKNVFPISPIITVQGRIKLTSIVTDANQNTLQSTKERPIGIYYKSTDESIATIDKHGNIRGKQAGVVQIIVYAVFGNQRSKDYIVNVNVVKENVSDVSEIYLSENGAYIDFGEKRKFRLTAVDYSGRQTSLSEGKVSFALSNDNVKISKESIDLKGGGEAIEIELEGISKGYTFVTPIYEFTKNTETIKITGTPLVVQVKDVVNTSKPLVDDFFGGNYIDLAVEEDEGRKHIHVTHWDKNYKTLKYSYFDGTWYNDMSSTPIGKNMGMQARVVLSPFSANKNKPTVLMMSDNKLLLYYQTFPSGAWLGHFVSEDIASSTKQFKENKNLIDMVSDGENLHIAYFDLLKNAVCVQKRTSPTNTSFNSCYNIDGNVTELSMDVNKNSQEPRIALVSTNKEITYLTVQNGNFFKERVGFSDGTEEHVRLKLDTTNKVFILASKKDEKGGISQVALLERQGNNLWGFKNVSEAISPKIISGIDLALDLHNEPKIVFSADNKVKVVRRVYVNGQAKWLIDTPNENSKQVVNHVAVAIDSSNSAHVVYSDENEKWFRYWVEPNFFDYQIINYQTDAKADVIRN